MQRSLRRDRDSHRLAWVVILIATLLVARAVAGAPIPPSPAAPLEVGEPFLSELGLEPARAARVLEIVADAQARHSQLAADLAASRLALAERLAVGDPQEHEVLPEIDRTHRILGELEKNRMQTVLRIWSLLDDAERDRWIRAGQVRNGIVLH